MRAAQTDSAEAALPAPFRVGIATWPGFAPGYIAKEHHLFGNLPVDFSIIDDFSARQSAFVSAKTDATIYTLDSLAFDAAHGVEGKAVLVLDESNGADAIVATRTISTAAELRGKRIAYTRGSPAHYFLIAYLRKHGVSLDSIRRVEVDDPGRAGEAFMSGTVDAAVTWEPNISQITASGKGHVLESSRTAPGLIVDVLVVRNDVLQTRRKDVEVFINGWLRAIQEIKENRVDSYRKMAKALNIPEAEFPRMADGLLYADLARNRAILLPTRGSRAQQILEDANQVWAGEHLLTKAAEPLSLLDPDFVESAK